MFKPHSIREPGERAKAQLLTVGMMMGINQDLATMFV